jgi:hypothetical protein
MNVTAEAVEFGDGHRAFFPAGIGQSRLEVRAAIEGI